jgi:hypothetical protein
MQEAAAYEAADLRLAQFDHDTAEPLPTTFAVTAHPLSGRGKGPVAGAGFPIVHLHETSGCVQRLPISTRIMECRSARHCISALKR